MVAEPPRCFCQDLCASRRARPSSCIGEHGRELSVHLVHSSGVGLRHQAVSGLRSKIARFSSHCLRASSGAYRPALEAFVQSDVSARRGKKPRLPYIGTRFSDLHFVAKV